MLRGLYTSWTGMVNEQKRLDVISNNMANSNTAGYKQESVSSQSFDKLLTIKIRDGSQAYHNEAIGKMSLGVKIGEVYTDFSQGSVRNTGGSFDLALSGKGFFTINYTNSNGETSTRYTRDGNFLVTREGVLVDSEGNRVQGEGGDIQLPTDAKNVVISNDGTVTADGAIIDRLKITDFADYDYIVKVGDNMYAVVDGATEKDAEASVLQGYIEMSNVNVVSEMVDMITITRAYEANQKVIRAMDSMLDRSATQVGKLG